MKIYKVDILQVVLRHFKMNQFTHTHTQKKALAIAIKAHHLSFVQGRGLL